MSFVLLSLLLLLVFVSDDQNIFCGGVNITGVESVIDCEKTGTLSPLLVLLLLLLLFVMLLFVMLLFVMLLLFIFLLLLYVMCHPSLFYLQYYLLLGLEESYLNYH